MWSRYENPKTARIIGVRSPNLGCALFRWISWAWWPIIGPCKRVGEQRILKSLGDSVNCVTTGAALPSMRSLIDLPASALRVARTRSKRLISDADSLISSWRAIYARKRSPATFIAVTGSSGKTTTAALIAHILSGVAPVRSQVGTNVYRAHVRSLQHAPDDGYFVSETGSSGPGTLQPVLNVVRPTVGVVTLVALEHKSTFRSVEAVAQEKAKLVEALPASGLAVLNHDDPRVAAMARRTKARVVTFGRTGGDYVISNVRCAVPGDLRLTVAHEGKAFEIGTCFTGAHYSLAVGAAFSCAHQLGVPPAVIVERIASFTCVFARCSVHRVPNGPVFINDADKAPHHSLALAFDMLAGFQATRKRIVLGQISDSSRSDKVYAQAYRAARAVADQVIFVGQHAHRSRASAEDVATRRFVCFEKVADAAVFVKDTAIPDEIVLLKAAHNLHLERLMMMFFTPIGCWVNVCGRKSHCLREGKNGCGLYAVPFEQHNNAIREAAPSSPDIRFG